MWCEDGVVDSVGDDGDVVVWDAVVVVEEVGGEGGDADDVVGGVEHEGF